MGGRDLQLRISLLGTSCELPHPTSARRKVYRLDDSPLVDSAMLPRRSEELRRYPCSALLIGYVRSLNLASHHEHCIYVLHTR